MNYISIKKNHHPISFLLGNLRKNITGLTRRNNLLSSILILSEAHCEHSNDEELAVSGWSLMGARLGISQWVLSNCTVHYLFILGFISLFSLPLSLLSYLISNFELFLSQLTGFTFFCFSSPFHQGDVGESEWAAVWHLGTKLPQWCSRVIFDRNDLHQT